jgi:hypothetical protein
MPSLQDSRRIRNELIQLINLQLSALEKEVFGVLSDEEFQEYEDRHEFINELYEDLRKSKTKVA